MSSDSIFDLFKLAGEQKPTEDTEDLDADKAEGLNRDRIMEGIQLLLPIIVAAMAKKGHLPRNPDEVDAFLNKVMDIAVALAGFDVLISNLALGHSAIHHINPNHECVLFDEERRAKMMIESAPDFAQEQVDVFPAIESSLIGILALMRATMKAQGWILPPRQLTLEESALLKDTRSAPIPDDPRKEDEDEVLEKIVVHFTSGQEYAYEGYDASTHLWDCDECSEEYDREVYHDGYDTVTINEDTGHESEGRESNDFYCEDCSNNDSHRYIYHPIDEDEGDEEQGCDEGFCESALMRKTHTLSFPGTSCSCVCHYPE